MLTSLIIYKNIYGEYMEDIADMICQLHHSHLKKYFSQQQHDINF